MCDQRDLSESEPHRSSPSAAFELGLALLRFGGECLARVFSFEHLDVTLAFERERNLVNVIADAPQGAFNSIPAVWEVTCPELAIVRLHGRNHETWNKKGLKTSAERFNYDYSTEELSGIADSVRQLAERVSEVDVILNNNFEDQGQRNGREIARLLNVEVRSNP